MSKVLLGVQRSRHKKIQRQQPIDDQIRNLEQQIKLQQQQYQLYGESGSKEDLTQKIQETQNKLNEQQAALIKAHQQKQQKQ
jgi:hypothetical protein